MPIFADRLRSADTLIYEIETTLGLDTVNSTSAPSVSTTLRLYDIFIPLLGVFIIVLNLAVVISSGLILKRGESFLITPQYTLPSLPHNPPKEKHFWHNLSSPRWLSGMPKGMRKLSLLRTSSSSQVSCT